MGETKGWKWIVLGWSWKKLMNFYQIKNQSDFHEILIFQLQIFQFNCDNEGIKLQALLALYKSCFYFLMSTECDLSVKLIFSSTECSHENP